MDINPRIAIHFRLSEFKCTCCGRVKVEPKLVAALQELRYLLGTPIIITSAFRCPKHNEFVGGVKNSLHLSGLAVDCTFPGKSLLDAYLAIERIPPWTTRGGIGLYPKWKDGHGNVRGNFIHLDVGKKRKRWGKVRERRVAFATALLSLKGSES